MMVEVVDDPTKTAQTVAPDSEPTNWMSSEGVFGEGTPENIQALLDNKKWTNINQLVESFSELEKYKGIASGKHVALPEDINNLDAMSEVFNAIGRPETAEGYEFTNETGVEITDELMGDFKKFAHLEGYSQRQLTGAINFQLNAAKASEDIYNSQLAEREESNIEAMKGKWKDQYEPTMVRIDAAAEKMGIKEFFKSRGIDKEPEVINMLLTIANSDLEDVITDPSDPKITQTPLERLEEIKKSDAFTKKFHIDHKATMTEYMALCTKIANSGEGRAPRN